MAIRELKRRALKVTLLTGQLYMAKLRKSPPKNWYYKAVFLTFFGYVLAQTYVWYYLGTMDVRPLGVSGWCLGNGKRLAPLLK